MSVVSFLSAVADILLILATTNLEAEHRNSSYHKVPPLDSQHLGGSLPYPAKLILTHIRRPIFMLLTFAYSTLLIARLTWVDLVRLRQDGWE